MFAHPLRAAVATIALLAVPAFAQEDPPRHVFLEGHTAGAYALALSPDGRNPIAGAVDGTVRVWDRETNEVVHVFAAHDGTVTALATSPDGRAFASAGIDGRVRLFDLPRRHALRTFAGVPEPPTSIAVALDGSLVVAGHQSNRVRMWNGENGQHVRDFPGVTSPTRDVAWLPEAGSVIAVEESGRLHGWNASNGESLGVVEAAPSKALAATSVEDRIALAGDDGLVRLVNWPPAPATELHTHGNTVTAVAITADGRFAASGGTDSLVHVIDLEKGKVVESPKGQPGQVTAVDFSPDGTRLATGGHTGSVKLWTTEKSEELALIQAHPGPVHSVRFHPSDGTLATSGDDGSIRLWRVPETMQTWDGHKQAIAALTMTADGKTLVTASGDKSVRVWNAEEQKPTKTLTEHAAGAVAVAVDAEGTQVASGDAQGNVRVVAVEDKAVRGEWKAHEGGVTGAAFVPNSRHVWTTGGDGFAKLWDPAKVALADDGEKKEGDAGPPSVAAVQADAAKLHALKLLADGKRFLTAGEDRFVKLWQHEGETAKELRRFGPAPAPVAQLAVSADESRIAAGGDPLFNQKTVFVWETANGKAVQTIQVPAGITDLAFGPHGLLVVGGADKKLRLYDPATGLLRETIDVPAVPGDVIPSGETAVLAAASDGKLYRVDTATTGVLSGHQGAVTSLVWSNGGKELISGGADKTLRRWTVADGEEAGRFGDNPAPVTALETTPDGTQLVAGCGDNHVRVWALDDPGKVRLAIPHPSGVLDVAATADHVVAGGADNKIHVWHLETGKRLEQLVGHGSAVAAVAAQDGTIVSGSNDRKVRRWTPSVAGAFLTGTAPVTDVAWSADDASLFVATENRVETWSLDPLERSTTFNAQAPVTTIALSREPARVASGSGDGSVSVWNAADGQPIASTKLEGAVQSLFLSPDGANLVATVGNASQNLGLLPGEGGATTLEKVHDAIGPEQPVTATAWAAEAELLFGVSQDRSVYGWTVASHRPRATFTGHAGPVYGLAFGPDSLVLASGGADGEVRLWDAAGRESGSASAAVLDDHAADVSAVAFSSDGLFASADVAGRVRLWNLDANVTFDLAPTEAGGEAWRTLSFAPNGNSLVAAGTPPVWQQWSTRTLEPEHVGLGHNGTITKIVHSSDGNRLATVDSTGLLATWNAGNGDLRFHEQLPFATAHDVVYAPDGSEVIVTGDDPRPLRVVLPSGAR